MLLIVLLEEELNGGANHFIGGMGGGVRSLSSARLTYADNKSRIAQIVLLIPAAMQGGILTAVFTLTKLYHATQIATHAL